MPPSDIEPLPGVDQLPSPIECFTSAGATEARLTMPSDGLGSLSRETSSTAYRLVVEAPPPLPPPSPPPPPPPPASDGNATVTAAAA
ncbi:hypothetical protein ACFTZI_17210 [Streptomyces decoyicus]|uniref:hypothetical protein n=1 Tax=Streptomyces decoyicus TaxID=249567 RepID=UPI00362A9506